MISYGHKFSHFIPYFRFRKEIIKVKRLFVGSFWWKNHFMWDKQRTLKAMPSKAPL